jgi:hypothetical protein
MFGAIDAGMAVLSVLMLALGIGPGLLALSSDRARTPRYLPPMPRLATRAHGLYFGAATAARRAWG